MIIVNTTLSPNKRSIVEFFAGDDNTRNINHVRLPLDIIRSERHDPLSPLESLFGILKKSIDRKKRQKHLEQ